MVLLLGQLIFGKNNRLFALMNLKNVLIFLKYLLDRFERLVFRRDVITFVVDYFPHLK